MFLYADGRIQWTTGDDSGGFNGLGGTEALAGINAGDDVNSVTIPGSLTSSIIDITQTSNVDIPGVWMFKVGEGMYVMCIYFMYIYVIVFMCVLRTYVAYRYYKVTIAGTDCLKPVGTRAVMHEK